MAKNQTNKNTEVEVEIPDVIEENEGVVIVAPENDEQKAEMSGKLKKGFAIGAVVVAGVAAVSFVAAKIFKATKDHYQDCRDILDIIEGAANGDFDDEDDEEEYIETTYEESDDVEVVEF